MLIVIEALSCSAAPHDTYAARYARTSRTRPPQFSTTPRRDTFRLRVPMIVVERSAYVVRSVFEVHAEEMFSAFAEVCSEPDGRRRHASA